MFVRLLLLVAVGWTVYYLWNVFRGWSDARELKRNDGVVLPDGRFAYVRGTEVYEDGQVLYLVETLEGEQDVFRRDQLVKRLR